ncbi:major facilitator superfamily domain-containing protein [Mycena rosella]|uniref:Major facilitator superfamily domain-containing protein n=1 Tax=Mycena rosella TaxID=1033263 RepID=A0AAD7DHP7_MYCRO|nr:major facilitator superfamily domain-containing protein [Mycena rosella]
MADHDDASNHAKPEGRDAATILNNLRTAALAEVDNAGLIWFHVKVIFTDSYDLFAINLAVVMLGYVYGTTPDRNCRPTLNNHQNLALKVAAPVGNFSGSSSSVVGRHYGVELIIMIVGTFAQATAGGGQAMNIIAMLIFWRFIATISSEFASTRIRGRMMTAVFAAQGWGNFAASLCATVITILFRSAMEKDFPTAVAGLNHVDYMWRLLIGLGCVPAALALYFRLTIPETPRFTMDIQRNVEHRAQPVRVLHRANAPTATRRDFLHYFGQWQNLRVLIGTAYSWFAIDVAFYTLGLNSSVILEANLYHLCIGNLILSLAGLIPGYWLCFLFIDRWGRRPIQLMGFIVLTVLFIIMGASWHHCSTTMPTTGTKFFVFLFCLANLFQNFGPNTTTFITPGELFPTRYRSTAHGISAAAGKLGAIVAQIMFNQLVDPLQDPMKFLGHSFEILAGFMFTGIFSTLLSLFALADSLPGVTLVQCPELHIRCLIGTLPGPFWTVAG